jgi:hypothetical protein
MNKPCECEMAMNLLNLHLRLIQSALGQKREMKPVSHRLCSQGRAVMRSHGRASLRGGMGLLYGRACGRASALRAKSVFLVSMRSRATAHAVSGRLAVSVSPAITFGNGLVHFTDEVLRHSGPLGWISAVYKPNAKGPRYVSVTGRDSPPPRLGGCQQRQSRGAEIEATPFPCSERQNLRVPTGSRRFMGPVSPAIEATQWPGGTSSCQLAGSLSNSPQQSARESLAVPSR